MRDLPVPARDVGSCVLCDGPNPLDLTVCLDCTSRTGDGLVFVRQSIRKVDRGRVLERLRRILPPGIDWEAFSLAARGYLPLASVPLPAAEQVLGAFAHESVPAHVIPKHLGVAPIPAGLSLVLLSVLVGGSLVGILTGQLLFLGSPLYAGLLWVLAQLHLRRPAACDGRNEPWLPRGVEKRVVAALVSLPVGTPRTLLADSVRLGHLLWERAAVTGDVDIVADTAQLLAIAADAATDLARVEEARWVVASQRAEGSAEYVTRAETLEEMDASRQRLHDQLLDVVRTMGGANRRLPEAGGQGAEMVRLADAIETRRAALSGAAIEIERLLA